MVTPSRVLHLDNRDTVWGDGGGNGKGWTVGYEINYNRRYTAVVPKVPTAAYFAPVNGDNRPMGSLTPPL